MAPEEQAWLAREYLSGRTQQEIAASLHVTASAVNVQLRKFCDLYTNYDVSGRNIYDGARKKVLAQALTRHLEQLEEITEPIFRTTRHEALGKAREEHAWLLRAEGASLQQIGDALGVCRQRAGQLINHFGRRAQWAIRRTRWRYIPPPEPEPYLWT